jgi:type 1 glutamine amidotransferase
MKSIKQFTVLLCILLLGMCSTKEENLNIVFISGSNEYVSHHTLKEYKKTLEENYSNVRITLLQADGPLNEKGEYSNLEGTDALKDCDILLMFARRTTISGKAIDDIKKYVASGKPLVAMRTSSHGFQSWPEFDKEVLGGNYTGHYAGEPEKREIGADGMAYAVGEPVGPSQTVTVDAENKNHPVLAGITDFTSKYSLYKTSPIATGTKLVLTGKTSEGEEPVAWARDYNGSRIVYIALGGAQDWKNPIFVRLVTNALFWSADFPAKERSAMK